MLQIINPYDNILEIQPDGPLQESDFLKFGTLADGLIAKHGTIRLLINASTFKGWESITAAEKHFAFVKGHHQKVEKLAMVAPHVWQQWLIPFIKTFIHPEVKTFAESELDKAKAWILE